MPQVQIAKAVLIPMNGDQVETDVSKHIVVQFNPATLRVTLSNTLKADNHGGSSGAAAQYVDKSESSLAVELLFDTTVAHEEVRHAVTQEGETGISRLGAEAGRSQVAANSDVRKLTQRIAEAFMKPLNPESDRPGAPQRCRFQWGSFQFTGMVSNYSETLDFFAPEGIPLRATLALTFKEDRYQFALDESLGTGQREAPTFAPGGEGISADRATQAAGRDLRGWRDAARFNGLENPRFTPPGGLSLPAPDVRIPDTTGIAVLAGAEAIERITGRS